MKIESIAPPRSVEGLYIINRFKNAIYWGAWRQWLKYEIGRTFFPETMTALFELPPQTQELADQVALHVNKIRAMPDKTRGKGGLINPKAVPEHPSPWKRWTNAEMDEYEAKERAEFEAPPNRDLAEIAALIASTRKRYRYGARYIAAAEERQPLEYEPTPPELVAERARLLARKLEVAKASDFYARND